MNEIIRHDLTPEERAKLVTRLATHEEHPTITRLPGRKPVFRGFTKKRQEIVSYGLLATLVVAQACEAYIKLTSNKPEDANQSAANPEIQKSAENILTTERYIQIAEDLLLRKGINIQELSFIDQMVQEGYGVGYLERFGSEARVYITGEEGLKIRRVPISREDLFPPVGTIEYGKAISIIAECEVTNYRSGISERYGLMANPFRETMIPASAENIQLMSQAPNVIIRDSFIQSLEPGWVRLAESRGWVRFAEPVTPTAYQSPNLDSVVK